MSVLVTGATGFIGREVVRQLLRTGRRVVALARKRDGAAARERVAAALGPQPDDELDVVEGDLTAPACGLAPADRRRLRATIATVIHCAGDTSFAPEALIPYRAGHIEGPRGLLETLAGGRLSRWAHLSTAFVCGRRAGTILESEGDLGQAFNNVYEGVKLESETVMRAAGRRVGVDVRVVRPSIVVGPAPATSGGNPSNLFFGFIRLAAALAQMAAGAPVRLRIEGAPQVAFNIVPVGYVAAGLLALAEHPGGTGGTFHLVVRDAPTQAQMLAMITERLGVRGLSLIDAGRETFDGPSPLERRVSRMLEGYRAYLTQDLRFDDANARRLLDPFVVPAATLSRDAVHQLIDLALIADEIPAPAAQPGVR